METTDYSYWITLAHLPNWRTERINNLLADIVHNYKISFAEFFSYDISTPRNVSEKGVDRIALETAIENDGKGIVILEIHLKILETLITT
ncbi:MAG: hypothetical protein KAT65_02850 [Methanophagales archaeon]|nr:hypothetical protein [Methanophagales archaeon]